MRSFFANHFNTNTDQGRKKLLLLTLWIFMGMYVLKDYKISSEVKVASYEFKIEDKFESGFVLEDDEDEVSASFNQEREELNEELSYDAEDEHTVEDIKDIQRSRLKKHGKHLMDFFNKYRSLKEVNSHFAELTSRYSDLNIIFQEELGTSESGKVIYAYRIGKNANNKAILALGLEHAAEWPSMMSLSYLATRFVQLYGVNQDITAMLDGLNLYIIPLLNPEGYAISRSSKKNRFFQGNKKKNAVDLGLDYGRFTQTETRSLRRYITDRDDIVGFLSVQCCGEAVIIPRLPTCFAGDAKEDVYKVGKNMILSLKEGKKNKYRLMQESTNKKGKSKLRAKKATWSERFAVDWASTDLDIKYSYMLEARGGKSKKNNHLDLPADEIISVSREVTKAVLKLGEMILLDDNAGTTGCEVVETEKEADERDGESEEDLNDLLETGFEVEDKSSYSESDILSTNDSEDSKDEYLEEDNFKVKDEEDEPLSFGFGEEDEESIELESSNGANVDDEEDASYLGTNDDDNIQDFIDEDEEVSGEDEDSLFSSSDSFQNSKDDEGYEADEDAVRSTIEVEEPSEEYNEDIEVSGDDQTFLYFAYNHDMMIEILRQSGVESAKKIGKGVLKGYKLDFTYHSRKTWASGISDILKQKSSEVYGVIYEVSEADHVLLKQHNLDFSSSRKDPLMKWKKSRLGEVQVRVESLESGNSVQCTTFKVRSKMPGKDIFKKIKRFAPSRQYKNCLMKAATGQKLPLQYVQQLEQFSTMISDKGPLLKSNFRNPAVGELCDP